jgi:hypothetical protein
MISSLACRVELSATRAAKPGCQLLLHAICRAGRRGAVIVVLQADRQLATVSSSETNGDNLRHPYASVKHFQQREPRERRTIKKFDGAYWFFDGWRNIDAKSASYLRSQIRQCRQDRIGRDAQTVGAGGRPIDPEDLEAKRLRACDIPIVRGHESDFVLRDREAVDGELIDARIRLLHL